MNTENSFPGIIRVLVTLRWQVESDNTKDENDGTWFCNLEFHRAFGTKGNAQAVNARELFLPHLG